MEGNAPSFPSEGSAAMTEQNHETIDELFFQWFTEQSEFTVRVTDAVDLLHRAGFVSFVIFVVEILVSVFFEPTT
ncbi:hypothetical protein N9V19_01740 [Opitutales bacterium]|nr:hypothetical protein [Opitutales bacterium]MDA9589821.1 hypothetical protein [Opitutales bacterium]MDB2310698.1 hypothetical protein [Opitutales bacterium]MDB2507071.1 hypothetical protein [Opitutales bacterium]